MLAIPPPRYPNQSISWKHIDRAIDIEGKVIDILFFPFSLFRWLDDQIRWMINGRGRMKKKRVRSIDDIEQGHVYYIRHPDPDIAAFCVYYQQWSEWDNDYTILYIHITESGLLGKGNTEWVKRRLADEKGWPYETDYLSYDTDEWTIPDEVDFEDIDAWVDENVPPEERLVLADLGMEGIKPAFDTVTTEEDIREDIDKRIVYRVVDKPLLDKLASCGLHGDYDRWRDLFERKQNNED